MSMQIRETPIADVQENDVIAKYGTVRAIREMPDSRVLIFDEPIGPLPVPREGDFTAQVIVRA